MIRKHCLPLTYLPKIDAVLNGDCRQTIRAGRRVEVGDWIMFHGWQGKPYKSKWSFRTPYWRVITADPIRIRQDGIFWFDDWYKWVRQLGVCEYIASADYIDPPTGEALRDVLFAMHKIPEEGIDAQIIRWKFKKHGGN